MINKSTVARMAGNIAAGIVANFVGQKGDKIVCGVLIDDIAELAVDIAMEIADRVDAVIEDPSK